MKGMLKAAFAITLVLFLAETAVAQAVRVPRGGGHPFRRDVTGFMQMQLGVSAIPAVRIEGESKIPGTYFETDEETVNIPGLSLSMFLIPTWGKNGLIVGASYDLSGGTYKQTLDDGQLVYEGEAAWAIGLFAARAGYIHYFGDGQWHPYVLGDAGAVWEKMRIESSYDDVEERSDEARVMTALVGAGVGLGKEIVNGLIGLEVRAEAYPFPVKYGFTDALGRYDVTVTHPVVFKATFIFALGHL